MIEKPICNQIIYEFKISDELLESTLENVKNLDFRENNENSTSINSFLFEDDKFLELKNFCLEKFSQIYQKYYKFEKIQITQSWANKSLPNQWHHVHAHPNSIISMILYLTDSDSYTWFSTKNIWYENFTFLNIYLLNNSNVQNELQVIHKEKSTAGKMLIFPSHLYHSVDENKSFEPRYTISCNTFLEGNFGDVINLSHVNIPKL